MQTVSQMWKAWKFTSFSTTWMFENIKTPATSNQNFSRGWMLEMSGPLRTTPPHRPHQSLLQPNLHCYRLHLRCYLSKERASEALPRTAYWSCWCIGRAICGGTLMNLSLSRRPTGLLVSFKSLSSCSTMLCSQLFSQELRTNSLICSAHWVPWKGKRRLALCPKSWVPSRCLYILALLQYDCWRILRPSLHLITIPWLVVSRVSN